MTITAGNETLVPADATTFGRNPADATTFGRNTAFPCLSSSAGYGRNRNASDVLPRRRRVGMTITVPNGFGVGSTATA